MRKILLTHPDDALVRYYGDRALANLRKLGEVRLNTTGHELELPALLEAAQGCEVIVSYRQTPGPAALFQKLPDLVAFCRCAVDIRNIDVDAASAQGILITQAGPGFVAAVAEWVVAALINLGRQIIPLVQTYHEGSVPVPSMGRELRGSVLGVIGYGRISRYVCNLARAFGMTIRVFDPYVVIDDPGIEQVGLEETLHGADFVVCLAVATEETENLMNVRSFSCMKRGAFFINASRGNLVDEAALLDALESGQIAGCAMDVGRAPDQMPTPALATHPRVIATPHMAGLTPQAIEFQALQTAEQVAAILSGRVPEGSVNASQATRMQRLATTAEGGQS